MTLVSAITHHESRHTLDFSLSALESLELPKIRILQVHPLDSAHVASADEDKIQRAKEIGRAHV